jgi:hypothetical protein
VTEPLTPDGKRVAACLVTKGGYDIAEVEYSIPFRERYVYRGNFHRPDYKIFGRYKVMACATASVCYTQDDDCIVDVGQVLANYQPGAVACNMPAGRRAEYSDGVALIGWGAIFDIALVAGAFSLYLKHWPFDELFWREADRVFTALNRVVMIDVPFEHLDRAYAPDRMGQEGRHWADLVEIRRRIAVVKQARAVL